MTPTSKSVRPAAARRGQTMVEYSMLSWLLLVALVLGCTARLIPGPRGQRNVIELFVSAYQTYYDSFHFVLNSPFP